jgi:hypothetical protein
MDITFPCDCKKQVAEELQQNLGLTNPVNFPGKRNAAGVGYEIVFEYTYNRKKVRKTLTADFCPFCGIPNKNKKG